MRKKIILITIVGLIIFAVYQGFFQEEESKFTLAEATLGNVVQEVSETGQVQAGEEIKLAFKNEGRIEAIYVRVGDIVPAFSALVKLETDQLNIELQSAQAELAVARAELNKILAGFSEEEIQVARTTLENAEQSLEDVKQKAEDDLNQAYQDALATLDGSYEKGWGALTTVTSIRKTYFVGNDQESIAVKEKENEIKVELAQAKEYITVAKASGASGDIDEALFQLKNTLNSIYNSLDEIRNMMETASYKNEVTDTDRDSLDTKKVNVNTGLTNIINAQQTITSTKISNKEKINTAEGKVQKARDELAVKTAGPRQVEIDLYQARINQAQAQVDLLENKIRDAVLRAPLKGQITEVNKKVGEIVQPVLGESIITLLPTDPYQIEVDIYEEDVVKVDVGDEVDIELIAFPGQIFHGKVISINPAEKLIEGVVYYEVKVNFEEVPEGIKPGMTADLTIKTESKENVLVVPENAVKEKEGKQIVQVLKDKKVEERVIEIGLIGDNNMVEVVSGLLEGEKVIID